MQISLVVPSRNNLRYFKWMYESVRKNQGEHEVFICAAADACTDGTEEWFSEISKVDDHFKYIVNAGPERLGHTILYDQIVRDLVTTEIAMIWHSDMYLCPGALDAIENHMFNRVNLNDNRVNYTPSATVYVAEGYLHTPKRKTITSLTRIEPPLHPDGPEKILADFGTEPEEFDEKGLLERIESGAYRLKSISGTTEGIFAPWAFWVKDFKEIGGHDPLYAPQSKEDSDIFNRFQLNGVEFIQSWEGFVYHMTCRGSRRNTHDGAPNIQTDSPEWLAQNKRSTLNFIRKWGSLVQHDEYLKPIIPGKYDIGIVYTSKQPKYLQEMEVLSSDLYLDMPQSVIDYYIQTNQQDTAIDLSLKIHCLGPRMPQNEILIYVDELEWRDVDVMLKISTILDSAADTLETSSRGDRFRLGSFTVEINTDKVNRYEHVLIRCDRKKGYFDEKMEN